MKSGLKNLFKSFSIELPIYTLLVVGYFFLVLHFLGDWLYHLFQSERKLYATMAVLLIVVQGFVLEMVTTFLLRLFIPKPKA